LVEHGKNDLFLQIESVKKLLGVKWHIELLSIKFLLLI
jgi:hypothetical protein